MKKSLLGVVALVLAGCGLPQGSGPSGVDLSKGCKTCGVANKISDKKCGEDKCFAKVCEPVMTEVKVPVYEDVEKECFVVERKKIQVPVKTYKVIDEWVDSPVREAYYETVKVRAKRKVPVTDEKFVYARVPGAVDVEVNCPKIITGTKEVCKPVRVNDRIVRYDKCGKVEELPITREGSVVTHQCERTIENAVCTIKRMCHVDKPMFVNDDTRRNGYYTEEVQVKKYRTVPGKVLRKRRICQTVMADKWIEEKRPVTRTIREQTHETTEKKLEYVTRKVQVDCETGVPVASKSQIDNPKGEAEAEAAAKVAATAAAAEEVKDAVAAPAAPEAAAAPAAPAEAVAAPEVQG